MKKSIGWFVSTLGTFCLYQGNLNSKMRHKLKALVKEEALDAKPEQTLQQTMHCVNTRQEISSSDAGSVPGMGGGGGGGNTPGNSWWAVPPGFQNPDPISNPKNVIFSTLFQTRLLKSMIG